MGKNEKNVLYIHKSVFYSACFSINPLRVVHDVCVCCHSIYSGRTSRGHTGGRPHRISHPPSLCGACLDFSREKDSAFPFPCRQYSRILCTNELIVLYL